MFRRGFRSLSTTQAQFLWFRPLSKSLKNDVTSQKMAMDSTTISKPFFSTTKILLYSLPAAAFLSTAAAPGVKAKQPNDEDVNIRRLAHFDFIAGRHPEMQWAEQKDRIYLTVMCEDAKDAKVSLDQDGVFTFSGMYGAGTVYNRYELKLDLLDKVDVEKSKVYVGEGKIFCILMKAEEKFWNKLLRGDGKLPHYVKYKWVDGDGNKDIGGMAVSKFGDMGGSGDMSSGTIDIDGMVFDFGGFFEKGGKFMARYKYRKFYEMRRRMGKPEDEEDYNFDIADPADGSNIHV